MEQRSAVATEAGILCQSQMDITELWSSSNLGQRSENQRQNAWAQVLLATVRTTRLWPHLKQPKSQMALGWGRFRKVVLRIQGGLARGRKTMRNRAPWRRAGELANDRCSQSLGGLHGEVMLEWEG